MFKMAKHFILSALLLALAIPSFAQRGQAHDGWGMGKEEKLAALQLSPEQEDQMIELRYAKEKILIPLRANLQTELLELKRFKQADEPNKKKVYAQIEKVGKQQTAIKKARFDHYLEVRKVLSEEQLRIFQKKIYAKAGRHGHEQDGRLKKRGKAGKGFRK